jgi:hypothetical protein
MTLLRSDISLELRVQPCRAKAFVEDAKDRTVGDVAGN